MAAEYTFTDNGNSVTVTSTLTQSMALDFPKNSVLISKHKLGSRTVLRFTVYGFVALEVDHSQIITPATADIDADLVALRDFFNSSANNSLVVTDTYSNWETARSGATLTPGTTVVVSDRGDLGIQLTAVTESQFSFAGMGGFLNPDWQAVGVYTGTPTTFTNQRGLWDANLDGSLVVGDVVVWNNLHYQLEGSVNGSDPSTNTGGFTALPRTTADVGYIGEWCVIEFDFANDHLQRRLDSRGNDVKCSKSVAVAFGWTPADMVANFKWGCDTCYSNSMIEAKCDNRNFGGQFWSNSAVSGCEIFGNSGGSDSGIRLNRLDPQSKIKDNILGSTGIIVQNELGVVAEINANDLSGSAYGAIYGCVIQPQKAIAYQTFSGMGTAIQGCVIGNSININGTISATTIGKRTESGFSNFEATIDIGTAMDVIYSGLAGGPFEVGEAVEFDTLETGTITADAAGVLTIDRNGTPCYGATTVTQTTGTNAGASANVDGQYARLVIPSEKAHCGIIKVVSGNSEEVVNAVYGHPTAFDYIVKPSTVSGAMAKLTLVHTAFSPLVADSVCLSDGTAILELLSNSDSAVFRNIAGRNSYVASSQLGQ